MKTKSKEEILAEHTGESVDSINDSESVGMTQSEVLPAMEEYAKQEAEEFAIWLNTNRWYNFENGKWHYTHEHGTSISRQAREKHYMKTTSELFLKYKQDK